MEPPNELSWMPLHQLVVSRQERRNPKDRPNDPIVYIDISSIDAENGAIRNVKNYIGKTAPSRAQKVVRDGDVIFSTVRPQLRNIALITSENDNHICSTAFCVLRPNLQLIIPKFLFYICRSVLMTEKINRVAKGTSFPAITEKDLLETTVPVPSKTIQRRVIAALDVFLAELQFARTSNVEIQNDVNSLISAAVDDVFTKIPIHNTSRYTLSQLLDIRARLIDPSTESYTHLPHIGVNVIISGECRLQKYNTVGADYITGQKYLFSPGDVLYSKIRPQLKKSTLVNFTGVCSTDIYPLHVTQREILLSEYLQWLLISELFVQYTNKYTKGLTIPRINQNHLLSFQINIPNIREQRKIASYLGHIQEQVMVMNETLEVNKHSLNRTQDGFMNQIINSIIQGA